MPATSRVLRSVDPMPSDGRRPRERLVPSTTSKVAASLYRDAIDRFHAAEVGAAERLDEATAQDPDFALAHAARWMLARAEGDSSGAHAPRERTLALRATVTGWEADHIDALGAMLDRRPAAWTLAHAHLAQHPEDLLVASHLVGDLFFHGRDGKREAVVRVLRELAPHHGDDWAFTSRLGFHLSELGQPGAALDLLHAAIAARPGSPYVAHSMAHVLLETGDRAGSHRFLGEWAARHDATGPLDGHIHWHLSLGDIEGHRPAAALERYARATAPDVSHCAPGLVLADAAGLFGRLFLDGVPFDAVPRERVLAALAPLKGLLGAPFVATHAAALLAALGEPAALDGCLEAMNRRPGASEAGAAHRVVTAFRAYLAGDMRACVESLEPDRPTAWEAVGGSNEERALIGTLLARARERLARP